MAESLYPTFFTFLWWSACQSPNHLSSSGNQAHNWISNRQWPLLYPLNLKRSISVYLFSASLISSDLVHCELLTIFLENFCSHPRPQFSQGTPFLSQYEFFFQSILFQLFEFYYFPQTLIHLSFLPSSLPSEKIFHNFNLLSRCYMYLFSLISPLQSCTYTF